MTIAPEELLPPLEAEAPAPASAGVAPDAPPPVEPQQAQSDEAPIHYLRIAITAALASASAAWIIGGLFNQSWTARGIGMLGVAIGAGLTYLSSRSARPALMQYMVLPAAVVVGAALMAPDARGGTANIFGLVGEALRAGGLRQPPIAFDPGWRFVLVVLLAMACSGASLIAVSKRKPAFAVIVPMPLVLGGALLQPKGAEITSSTVGVFLAIAALGVAHGSELAGRGSTHGAFESRRLMRGAAMLAALMVAMVGLAKAQLLFPDADKDRVIPPQRPPASPPEPDRELFRVAADRPGPWRVGVLDVYDGRGWLLPPFDRSRLLPMAGGAVPGVTLKATERIAFHVSDIRGVVLPAPARAAAVTGPDALRWDPRIEVPMVEHRVPQGLEYVVSVAAPATARQMNAAPPAPVEIVRDFVDGGRDGALPPAPSLILTMLSTAPRAPFDRLQFLRDRLYANVTAAGGGSPVDVTPERVVAMFQRGAEASPFEIAAAEAILARWAGIPARLGFGYYGGAKAGAEWALHPRDARVWLEAYFNGYGWVPLVGTPAKAKPSDSKDIKNVDPRVRPSDELALTVFIPTERHTIKQLFEIVRFWIGVAMPFVLAILMVWFGWPAMMKRRRSRRRARWAKRNGPRARILVAYAEFRELCFDLNIGEPHEPPLTFLRHFQHDEQLEELSWLVTRALWGDLRRDLRAEDVEACDTLLTSVRRRLLRRQTLLNRVLARISRESLRDPYTVEATKPRTRRAGGVRLRWRKPAEATAMLMALALLASCATASPTVAAKQARFPTRIAPPSMLGYQFKEEPKATARYAAAGKDSLVQSGIVLSVRRADLVEASLQVAVLTSRIDTASAGDRMKVERSIGTAFKNLRFGVTRVRIRHEDERTLYLWFPANTNAMELFVARKKFDDAEKVVRGLIAYQLGTSPDLVAGDAPARVVNPGGSAVNPDVVGGDDQVCSQSTAPAPAALPPVAKAALTLVPGGTVSNGIKVEARAGIYNTTDAERTYTATFFLGKDRLGSQTVTVGPRAAGLAHVWFPTAGRAGDHTVLLKVTGGPKAESASASLSVLKAKRRVLPRLQGIWLDPAGLSPAVYPRDCAVTSVDVDQMVAAMHGAGMDTIIISYAEFGGKFYYPSSITFQDRDTGGVASGQLFDFDLIGTILDAADRNHMRVMIGLGRSGDTGMMEAQGADFDNRVKAAVGIATKVAKELWQRYGGHPSFWGWYLTHESNEIERAGAYWNPMADVLHSLSPDKPVMIAPAGAPQVDARAIRDSHADVFAYQDAVGAGYDGSTYTYDPETRIAQLDQIYKRYRSIHDEAGKHMWADLEVWEMDGQHGYSHAYPAAFGRVQRQINIESNYADFITANEWAGFLQSPIVRSRLTDPRARALFGAYAAYQRGDPR